jgi:hypothetical protein
MSNCAEPLAPQYRHVIVRLHVTASPCRVAFGLHARAGGAAGPTPTTSPGRGTRRGQGPGDPSAHPAAAGGGFPHRDRSPEEGSGARPTLPPDSDPPQGLGATARSGQGPTQTSQPHLHRGHVTRGSGNATPREAVRRQTICRTPAVRRQPSALKAVRRQTKLTAPTQWGRRQPDQTYQANSDRGLGTASRLPRSAQEQSGQPARGWGGR